MVGNEAPHVAVVGAGIGGLTLALALRRRGITVEVHEQADRLREVGAAVALSANATRLLAGLGLAPALEQSAAEVGKLLYRHWRDGHDIAAHPMGPAYRTQFKGPYLGIHRAALQQILHSACGDIPLRLNSRVTGVTGTPGTKRLELADGTTASADLVVGADGVHSTVRSCVTGAPDPRRYSGTSGFRGLVPASAVPALTDPDAIQFWMGPGAHVLHYPLDRDGTINFLAVLEGPRTWPATTWRVPAAPGELADAFADWHPAVRQMVDAAQQSDRWALFGQEPLRRWHRSGVVLIGDAAHAMLPHHGQGANQTVEDAVTLADCLATGRDPLTRYTRLRRVRTRQVQRSSWDASAVLHLPDGPEARARDARLQHFPRDFGWIHSHDAGRTCDDE